MTKVNEQVAASQLVGGGETALHSHTGAGVPSGIITMWHGLIANIPAGWVICDGNNGTPNLLARFVEGVATAATNPGATGGTTIKYLKLSGQNRASAAKPIGRSSAGAALFSLEGGGSNKKGVSDEITDIRPPFYDVAFIMKL